MTDSSIPPLRVGVIGLGVMGRPMVPTSCGLADLGATITAVHAFHNARIRVNHPVAYEKKGSFEKTIAV